MSSAGVVGRRERRRVVVSPKVRSAERISPIGSAVSEVSGEEGLFVGLDAGSGGSWSSGLGFARVGRGAESPGGKVGGRQEVKARKTKTVRKQKKGR